MCKGSPCRRIQQKTADYKLQITFEMAQSIPTREGEEHINPEGTRHQEESISRRQLQNTQQ